MTNEELQLKIESIFIELNTKFEKIDYEDDDLNYLITINSKKYIENINTVNIVMYFNIDDNTITTIAPNIYKLNPKDSELKFLQFVNKFNSELIFGRLVLNKNPRLLVYTYESNLGCGWENLDKEIIEKIQLNNLYTLSRILEDIGELKHEK